MKLPRGIFIYRGRIPGIGGGEGETIQSREAPGFRRHIGRVKARAGATSADQEIRAHGVPVFDRNAGLSELGGYLNPRD